MKKDFNKNAVIVLGGNINALGVVRSFEETDIPVYSFGERKNFVMRSRFCKGVVCGVGNDVHHIFRDILLASLFQEFSHTVTHQLLS